MDFQKSRNQQALITSMNRARMYDASRPSEVNTDGVAKKSEEASGWRNESVLNDMIEKGEISDSLASGYNGTPISINKTGKEIKEKIPVLKAALETQKKEVETKLLTIQQEAGVFPDQSNSRRYSKTTPFNRYQWSMCEAKYVNGAYEEVTDQQKACQKYNSLVGIYNEILDDIDAINVIGSNIQDSKTYSLSVSQLIALKFNEQ